MSCVSNYLYTNYILKLKFLWFLHLVSFLFRLLRDNNYKHSEN
jgi:hypothetical protein